MQTFKKIDIQSAQATARATYWAFRDSFSRGKQTYSFQNKRIPPDGCKGLEHAQREINAINRLILLRLISSKPYSFLPRLQKLQDKLLKKLEKYADPASPIPVKRVPYEEFIDGSFHDRHIFNSQPVIITGFNAPAFDWTMDSFFSAYGNQRSGLLNTKTWAFEDLPLNMVIKHPGDFYYANSEQIWRDCPELLSGLNLPALSSMAKYHSHLSCNFFIKKEKGVSVFLHNDGIAATFFLQIVGRKHWRMVDPYFAPLVYPILRPHDAYTACRFLNETEHEHLPLLKYCPYYEAELNEGEMIWNPTYFFHSIKNLTDDTMAIATRWNGWPGKMMLDPWPTQSKAALLSPTKFLSHIKAIKHEQQTGTPFNWYDAIAHGRGYPMSRTDMLDAWGIKPADELMELHTTRP